MFCRRQPCWDRECSGTEGLCRKNLWSVRYTTESNTYHIHQTSRVWSIWFLVWEKDYTGCGEEGTRHLDLLDDPQMTAKIGRSQQRDRQVKENLPIGLNDTIPNEVSTLGPEKLDAGNSSRLGSGFGVELLIWLSVR